GNFMIDVNGLAVGSGHNFTAVYGGDTDFAGSASSPLAYTVNRAGTTTTLTATAASSVFGQPVAFTANVSPVLPEDGTPTGLVMFLDGVAVIGSATLSDGSAQLVSASLSPGIHQITAVYQGDTNFVGSMSSPVSENVVLDTGSVV